MTRSISMLFALTLLAFIANGAFAALHDVKTVRVTQNSNNYLSLAEVQVFDLFSGLNVAASGNGGVASQTTTGFGGVASRANDNNTNGVYGGGSVSHTNTTTAGESWQVTLASAATINLIDLFGRTDCCWDRDNNLTLTVFNSSGAPIFTQNFGLLPDNAQGRATFDFGGIPEPASAGLLALGLGAMMMRRRQAA